MAVRGRKSLASLSVVGEVASLSVLMPPNGLSPEQKAIWMETVNSKPSEWFGREHIPMLEAYTAHVVEKRKLDIMLKAFDLEWETDEQVDAGLKRLEKLQKMHRVQTQAIDTLMRSMRLTHQSRYNPLKANTLDNAAHGKKPWQRQTIDNE